MSCDVPPTLVICYLAQCAAPDATELKIIELNSVSYGSVQCREKQEALTTHTDADNEKHSGFAKCWRSQDARPVIVGERTDTRSRYEAIFEENTGLT